MWVDVTCLVALDASCLLNLFVQSQLLPADSIGFFTRERQFLVEGPGRIFVAAQTATRVSRAIHGSGPLGHYGAAGGRGTGGIFGVGVGGFGLNGSTTLSAPLGAFLTIAFLAIYLFTFLVTLEVRLDEGFAGRDGHGARAAQRHADI
jgi:hypothetical protein